jgi:hypothetical protein
MVARIYSKLITVPEHRVHSILYRRSRTVFHMFWNSKWISHSYRGERDSVVIYISDLDKQLVSD